MDGTIGVVQKRQTVPGCNLRVNPPSNIQLSGAAVLPRVAVCALDDAGSQLVLLYVVLLLLVFPDLVPYHVAQQQLCTAVALSIDIAFIAINCFIDGAF